MFEYEDNEVFWLLPVEEKKIKLLKASDIVISNFEINLN